MTDAIAIDCCWFVGCGDNVNDFSDILRLLANMDRDQIAILFDHEEHIFGEYMQNVTSGLGRQFIQSCVRNGRVAYYSSSLSAAQHAALDRISFDPSDRPYLGVAAQHGSAPYLTTEEKHLNPEQAPLIEAASGVCVVDTARAVELLT